MPIRWDELEPQRYEDIVSVLLSRLYPEAQRIDGKGGYSDRDTGPSAAPQLRPEHPRGELQAEGQETIGTADLTTTPECGV